jgi:hypothetical protein
MRNLIGINPQLRFGFVLNHFTTRGSRRGYTSHHEREYESVQKTDTFYWLNLMSMQREIETQYVHRRNLRGARDVFFDHSTLDTLNFNFFYDR